MAGLLAVFIFTVQNTSADTHVEWWLTGSTYKVLPGELPPEDPAQPLVLHAARQEYAPFQVVLRASGSDVALGALEMDFPSEYFSLAVFSERYLPLNHPSGGDLFARSRLLDAIALPDGLYPFEGPLNVASAYPTVLWVDVYVQPDTPPGDYTISLHVDGLPTREVLVRVYPIDLPSSPSMNVIIPLEADETIPAYGGSDPAAFHLAVNALMLDHSIIPGTFLNQPVPLGEGWDFSSLEAELLAVPAGASFYVPLPYDEWTGRYWLLQPDGTPYTRAEFDNPAFVAQAKAYFKALAEYLAGLGRLEGALVYAVDETRWVGDEPIHNGPAGFQRLAQWAAVAHAAGLRVTASEVMPVPPGPVELGWLETASLIDDSHVHLDILDGALQMFDAWRQIPGKSVSVYLNEYGDLIDMSAAAQRGMVWHVYARGSRMIAGYAALEWATESYDFVDPWTEPNALYPVSGYGGGALIWPGPLPSLRLKLLREGIEDARLLDLYAAQTSLEDAEQFAYRLTPGFLADQTPSADLWDIAHAELLQALAEGRRADPTAFAPLPLVFTLDQPVADFDTVGLPREWETSGVTASAVESPWDEAGVALEITFVENESEAGLYFGDTDWGSWSALQIDVQSKSPYLTSLDVGVVDGQDHYVLLRDGSVLIGPNEQKTLTLPLLVPFDTDEPFDWRSVKYLALQVNTEVVKRDYLRQEHTWPLGSRTLVIDNIRLVK
ncbi:MAG: hypothetical protein Kow0077_07340 [Anaerolineae bacterium]